MALSRDRLDSEWLEADGLGGFASGTVAGWRTRRYHGLLTPAVLPPSGRAVLVDGFEAWIERDGRREYLTSQRYLPDLTHPDGVARIVGFTTPPGPPGPTGCSTGSRSSRKSWCRTSARWRWCAGRWPVPAPRSIWWCGR